jgi:hypothetical protein
MKILRCLSLVALLAAGLAFACGPRPQLHFAWDHEAAFGGLRTFAWYDDPSFQMPHGGGTVDGRFIDDHVRMAVEENLRKKGLEMAADGNADVYVAYHTSADGIVSQDKFGRYNWWSMTITTRTDYRKQGSLALDVRDSGRKLIWRGVISSVIVGTNPEAVARDIDEAVADLLVKFPPAPGDSPTSK